MVGRKRKNRRPNTATSPGSFNSTSDAPAAISQHRPHPYTKDTFVGLLRMLIHELELIKMRRKGSLGKSHAEKLDVLNEILRGVEEKGKQKTGEEEGGDGDGGMSIDEGVEKLKGLGYL